MKYASKLEQKAVPAEMTNCGRFWGVSGLRDCVSAAIAVDLNRAGIKMESRISELKRMLKEIVAAGRGAWIRRGGREIAGAYIRHIDDQLRIRQQILVIGASGAGGYGLHHMWPVLEGPDEFA